jgi:hypothetical protein
MITTFTFTDVSTLSTSQAVNDLLADEFASWTYNEAKCLVNFYEDLEDQQGEAIELDRVAIRRGWTKATEQEAREMYSIEGDVIEYLDNHGCCIEVEDYLLFLNF